MTLVGSWIERAGLPVLARRRAAGPMAALGLGAMVVVAAGVLGGAAPCWPWWRWLWLCRSGSPCAIDHNAASSSWWRLHLSTVSVSSSRCPPRLATGRRSSSSPPSRPPSSHPPRPGPPGTVRGTRPGSWPVGGLIALGLVSAVIVGGQQALTGFRIDYFYVLLGIAVWRCPLSERERDRLVTVLMVTGFLTAVWGICQQVLGAVWLNSVGYQYTTITTIGSFMRSFSTFTGDYEFGFFLMAVLLMGMPCALSDTRRLRNKVFLLCLPIFGLALALTFFRGGWLGVSIGGLYLGIRRYRVLLLALPAALLALLLLPGSFISTSGSTTSLGERTAGWVQNFDQVVSHPFGAGIGATGAAAQKLAELEAQAQAGTSSSTPLDINTSIPGTSVYQPDNYYYEALYDLGLPGLWMWILLLVSSFLFAARLAGSTSGMESNFALGVSAFVLAAATCSFFASFFENYPMDLLFWLLIWTTVSGHPVSDVAVRRGPVRLSLGNRGGSVAGTLPRRALTTTPVEVAQSDRSGRVSRDDVSILHVSQPTDYGVASCVAAFVRDQVRRGCACHGRVPVRRLASRRSPEGRRVVHGADGGERVGCVRLRRDSPVGQGGVLC